MRGDICFLKRTFIFFIPLVNSFFKLFFFHPKRTEKICKNKHCPFFTVADSLENVFYTRRKVFVREVVNFYWLKKGLLFFLLFKIIFAMPVKSLHQKFLCLVFFRFRNKLFYLHFHRVCIFQLKFKNLFSINNNTCKRGFFVKRVRHPEQMPRRNKHQIRHHFLGNQEIHHIFVRSFKITYFINQVMLYFLHYVSSYYPRIFRKFVRSFCSADFFRKGLPRDNQMKPLASAELHADIFNAMKF